MTSILFYQIPHSPALGVAIHHKPKGDGASLRSYCKIGLEARNTVQKS